MHELQSKARVGAGDVVQKLIAVFADERLFVVASNIVPRNTVVVDVVQNAQTRLARSVDVEFGVIGLSDLLVSRRTPWVVAETVGDLSGWCHLPSGGRPEPSVDALWFKVSSVFTTFEVAQTATGPNVWYIV